jgi:peptide/nickel transport system substrate-binding protein
MRSPLSHPPVRVHELFRTLALACVVLVVGCTSTPAGSVVRPASGGHQGAVTPKRLAAAINGNPATLNPSGGTFARPLLGLLHAGLSNPDEVKQQRAQLAEAVPSLENGLWRVFPDGRMETTWKIRPGAMWHDRVPFTSADALFTARMGRDRDLRVFADAAYGAVESVEALDPATLVVQWRELNINADKVFGSPMPRHLLEEVADHDKANFLQHPYWNDQFVGTGAFKLREWVAGEKVRLEANADYVLGRPRIDEIEIKLIPDGNVLAANLLAGTVEIALGQTLSLDQALELRSRWQQGRVEVVPREGWTVLYPQLAYTNPPIIADARFRRALLHAIDRQVMVDTLVSGMSAVPDGLLQLQRPEYQTITMELPHYGYEPVRANQIIATLGYGKRDDGAIVDAAGQRLTVEIRTSAANDNNVKAVQSVADYWQRLGLGVETVFVPRQQTDREYLATFPGFQMGRNTADETAFENFTSGRAPSAANNWTGGQTGFRDPEYDAVFARYSRTIPLVDRLTLLGRLNYQLAEPAIAMGMYYDNLVAIIGNRLENVLVPESYSERFVWSAYRWDLRS